MSLIIALAFWVWFFYMNFYSCTFNNHDWEVIERDENGFDKIQCTKCKKKSTYDPYEGICG